MERLNKYLAHAGLGPRRQCDDLILAGRVHVDGVPVRELGSRVDPDTQAVTVDGKPVQAERLVYWLVNKPKGYLCTNHDPDGRPRAIDLIPHVGERVYTVGRLDEDSEGLLLLTNDGDLAHKLMHPRFGVKKTYLVQVAGKPTRDDVQKLLDGIWLSDGHVKAQRVRRLRSQGDSTWLEIVLTEGKNREVRRMLAKLEHKVMNLKRTALGPIHLDRLKKGKSRKLQREEVEMLCKEMGRRPKTAGLEPPPRPEEKPAASTTAPRPPRPRGPFTPGARPSAPLRKPGPSPRGGGAHPARRRSKP